MLQANNVTFAYRHTAPVLQDFDFGLSRSERVGLWGKSGRGKTTLCRLLAGWEKPRQGTVLLDGRPLSVYEGFCPVQLLRQHPEQSFDPLLTLGQSLELSRTEERLFGTLGIREEWLRRYPAELSGGELQRLCIARALSGDVQYLLCDETGAMLDALTQAQLWRVLLREAEERELGLLIVSHDRALLQWLCTRIETL